MPTQQQSDCQPCSRRSLSKRPSIGRMQSGRHTPQLSVPGQLRVDGLAPFCGLAWSLSDEEQASRSTDLLSEPLIAMLESMPQRIRTAAPLPRATPGGAGKERKPGSANSSAHGSPSCAGAWSPGGAKSGSFASAEAARRRTLELPTTLRTYMQSSPDKTVPWDGQSRRPTEEVSCNLRLERAGECECCCIPNVRPGPGLSAHVCSPLLFTRMPADTQKSCDC